MKHGSSSIAGTNGSHKTQRFEDLKPIEVLALAIHVERANVRRYRAFADSFHGHDQVVQPFNKLEMEESKHETILISKFEERFGEDIPKVDESDVDVIIESADLDDAEHLIFSSLEARRVFELALQAEISAYKFYQRAASAMEDLTLVDLYRELAAMEDDHVKFVRARLNELDAQGGAL
jgi:rubrerythrin